MARDLDVVLYGATGFVGRLTAEHLAAHAPEGVRIGLAGRSQQRLEAVRAGLGARAADWPLLAVDAADETGLDALARRTRVVATTVGPYVRYGFPVVAACARAGTHYADLTGEMLFIRRSIDELDAVARGSGARIVHCAGFDCIPSDLGVWLLAETVREGGDGELTDTTFALTGVRGGVSGGTIASMQQMIDDVRRDPAARRLMRDPYALSPDRSAEPAGKARDTSGVRYDRELGRWTAPFVMAALNARVVRWSNALLGHRYGRGLRYQEAVALRGGPGGLAAALGVTAGTAVLAGGMALPPTRALLSRVLPAPGEGPSERVRRTGYFRAEIRTVTTTGARYTATVAADGDPGYQATSVMFGETALALALEADRLPDVRGVLTPAVGIGLPLVERLRDRGFTWVAEPDAS